MKDLSNIITNQWYYVPDNEYRSFVRAISEKYGIDTDRIYRECPCLKNKNAKCFRLRQNPSAAFTDIIFETRADYDLNNPYLDDIVRWDPNSPTVKEVEEMNHHIEELISMFCYKRENAIKDEIEAKRQKIYNNTKIGKLAKSFCDALNEIYKENNVKITYSPKDIMPGINVYTSEERKKLDALDDEEVRRINQLNQYIEEVTHIILSQSDEEYQLRLLECYSIIDPIPSPVDESPMF